MIYTKCFEVQISSMRNPPLPPEPRCHVSVVCGYATSSNLLEAIFPFIPSLRRKEDHFLFLHSALSLKCLRGIRTSAYWTFYNLLSCQKNGRYQAAQLLRSLHYISLKSFWIFCIFAPLYFDSCKGWNALLNSFVQAEVNSYPNESHLSIFREYLNYWSMINNHCKPTITAEKVIEIKGIAEAAWLSEYRQSKPLQFTWQIN